MDIEDLSSKNPNNFWNGIRKLGPRKDRFIPFEIVENGQIVTDENRVYERWKYEFEKLYHGDNDNDFDDDFFHQKCSINS